MNKHVVDFLEREIVLVQDEIQYLEGRLLELEFILKEASRPEVKVVKATSTTEWRPGETSEPEGA